MYPHFAAFVECASLMASDSCDPVYGSSSKSQTLRGKVDSYHSVTGAQSASEAVIVSLPHRCRWPVPAWLPAQV